VGWRYKADDGHFMVAIFPFGHDPLQISNKRQPAGTGRRWSGGFALIPDLGT